MTADSAIVMQLRYSPVPSFVCQIQSRGPVISPLIFPLLSTIDIRLPRGLLIEALYIVRRHDPTEPAQSFPLSALESRLSKDARG